MAELLRLGYTMLNEACPECNTPIFRNKNGELVCASCNRKIIIVENKDSEKKLKEEQSVLVNQNKLLNDTYNVLKKKITWILEKLDQEDQLLKIREYVNLLKDLYELLKIINVI